jgi:polyisoprenoid-binding protein YceI
VFTFKDGLLSPLAHDLKIRVEKVELELQANSVRAVFDASSLRVAEAGNLPRNFYSDIERNIRDDVLKAKRFPSIRFESTEVNEHEVVGKLTLCEVTREIRCARKDDATHHAVEARLDQRDFSIKPYTAMLGTLKVKPEVIVTVRVAKS